MKKTTLLVALCVFMGLINAGLLWWMLSAPHHPMHEGPRNIIIERLDFDAGQGARYDVLIGKHRKSIGFIETKVNAEKKALYALLASNESTKSGTSVLDVADSVTTRLGLLQREIELAHFHHFAEIRSVCRPDQIEKYDALCSELTELFAAPHMRKGRKDGPQR